MQVIHDFYFKVDIEVYHSYFRVSPTCPRLYINMEKTGSNPVSTDYHIIKPEVLKIYKQIYMYMYIYM